MTQYFNKSIYHDQIVNDLKKLESKVFNHNGVFLLTEDSHKLIEKFLSKFDWIDTFIELSVNESISKELKAVILQVNNEIIGYKKFFIQYEVTRYIGKYNMFTREAMIESGLTEKEYCHIIENYDKYIELYSSVEKSCQELIGIKD